jgi:uracil phosphoribosyltransferase
MKDILISILRNKNSTAADYRQVTERLGFLLALEASADLPKKSVPMETPLESTQGYRFTHPVVLVPILRAGLALLYPFMRYFPDAAVGFIGLRRDEETAKPHVYYTNLPPIPEDAYVIILEPMIATGGSSIQAISILCEHGVKEDHIIFISILGATSGIDNLRKRFPKIFMHVAQVDNNLNAQQFIVPGLGDFGDRYFGTVSQ